MPSARLRCTCVQLAAHAMPLIPDVLTRPACLQTDKPHLQLSITDQVLKLTKVNEAGSTWL